jgi:hypothetical protein
LRLCVPRQLHCGIRVERFERLELFERKLDFVSEGRTWSSENTQL